MAGMPVIDGPSACLFPCRRAVEGREAKLGPENVDTLESVCELAALLLGKKELKEAEALYRRAVQGREAALGKDAEATLSALAGLAELLDAKGDLGGVRCRSSSG